jgi:hypothetical protein
MKTLTPTPATAAEIIASHARQIDGPLTNLIRRMNSHYKDHPAQPGKVTTDPQTKQPVTIMASPAVTKAEIEAFLGPDKTAVLLAIASALPDPAPVAK